MQLSAASRPGRFAFAVEVFRLCQHGAAPDLGNEGEAARENVEECDEANARCVEHVC